jgi:hypothetical protein
VIPDAASNGDNLEMQYDFRQVYASVLRQWFGVPQDVLEAVLLRDFQALPIVDEIAAAGGLPETISLSQNYPNPFNPSTVIPFLSDGGPVTIKVYDTLGREVANL